jgi:hypothetical protein
VSRQDVVAVLKYGATEARSSAPLRPHANDVVRACVRARFWQEACDIRTLLDLRSKAEKLYARHLPPGSNLAGRAAG